MDNPRNALAPGYKLHWYTIKKILGQGGFGITYLAEDTNLNQNVAIKEFLPIEMAVRDQSSSVHPVSGEYGEQFKWGLDRFQKEAQTLAKFKHPNIVRVFSVFPENNTAYMVMEYEHGKGMDELLKNKKTLSEQQLTNIILPILDGLNQVHAAGFIHRDIKPANIFIRDDGTPVLLDFGSARQSFGEHTRTLTAMVSPGFAPFEQYVSKSDKQGPWTDIYGLAATMYRSIIGRSPAEAMDRSESLLDIERDSIVTASEMSPEGYSTSLLAAIDHGLEFKPENRPQSISAWLDELQGNIAVVPSEIETVVVDDQDNVKTVALNEEDIDKTVVLERKDEKKPKKKPSLFRRLLKYTFITFIVLFVLAILGEGNKKKQAELATSNIEELLSKAEDDLQALRLTKPAGNNAVEKYQAVLEIDQGNTDAKEGLYNVVGEYLKLAEKSIQNQQWDKANQYLKLAKDINPDHEGITAIKAMLENKSQIKTEDNIETIQQQPRPLIIENAEQEIKELFSTQEKEQISALQARVKDNPRDKEARKELQSIMKTYEAKVKAAVEENDFDTALSYIEQDKVIAPRSIRLKALSKRIEQKKKEHLGN